MEIEHIGRKFPELIEHVRPNHKLQHNQDVHVMLVDIDSHVPEVEKDFKEKVSSDIRMFCVDNNEQTFMVHVKNFRTYIYVHLPMKLVADTQEDLEQIRKAINDVIGREVVSELEVVEKASLTEFRHPDLGLQKFLKIYIDDASKVSKIRETFEKGFSLNDIDFDSRTYESSIDFKLRFMVDKDMGGMSWMTLPGGKFKVISKHKQISNACHEVEIDHSDLIVHPTTDKNWNHIAPLRILSFDIECMNSVGFPIPERDPVITIGIAFKTHIKKEEPQKLVLQLGTCDSIFGSQLITFHREEDLLEAFDAFLDVYDPDIILGFNIISFDLQYLVNRWNFLKANEKPYWGRYKHVESEVKKGKFQSKVMGFRELLNINTEGRIQIDMLAHMMREKKLRSYSLNYISYYFLNEQKEDVSYKIIQSLQEGDSSTRKRIATYCLKDSILPLTLFEKLKCIYSYVEMARVTGVPVTYILFKGQQIKVTSQIYRKTKHRDLLVPYMRRFKEEDAAGYQGADVLEPQRGFYDVPIATLDFASLYPSIMISHNMCYSTILRASVDYRTEHQKYGEPPKAIFNNLEENQVHSTPAGHFFVKKEVRRGILPEILEDLLSARKKTKFEISEAQNELANLPKSSNDHLILQKREDLENLIHVLDGRQLAIKVSANSVYGYTGASVGALPCLEIASSVTSIGRFMIEKTKNTIIERYSPKNGYEHQANVIYGDTDSVMVNFGTKDVIEAMRLGREAAEFLSDLYIKPIKLEFEKVYYPYLLLNKKRYAGLLWTKPEAPDRKDMKGVESVRRDNCLMVSTMVDKVLHIILTDKDIEKAKSYTKGMVADLLNNNVDISMLIITKGISRDIEGEGYKSKQPHVELVRRMTERNPNLKFHIGDRIPFVVLHGAKNSKVYENSEDPAYAFENNLPLDLNYYLDKQIKPPLERIFEVICDPKEIFEGEHTRKVKQQNVSTNFGIGKFMKAARTCAVCKAEIKDDTWKKAVCRLCEEKENDTFLKKVLELKAAETNFSRLWSECQRCDGSLFNEVKCTNTDCNIYFRRMKMKKEAQIVYQQYQKFFSNE